MPEAAEEEHQDEEKNTEGADNQRNARPTLEERQEENQIIDEKDFSENTEDTEQNINETLGDDEDSDDEDDQPLPDEWINVLVRPVDLEEAEENEEIRARVQVWLEQVIIGLGLCPFAEKPVRQTQQLEQEWEQETMNASNETNTETKKKETKPNKKFGKKMNKYEKKKLAQEKLAKEKKKRKKPLLVVNVVRLRGEEDLPYLMQWMAVELTRRAGQPGTTLVVCPECYPDDFERYLDVVNTIEEELVLPHYEGVLQVAPFHPQFRFDGSSDDENDINNVDNWTNRSPYPIFHLLREDEVESAVQGLDGDAGKVWKRNVNLLHAIAKQMGLDALDRLYKGGFVATGDQVSSSEDERQQLATLLKQHRFQPKAATTTTQTAIEKESGKNQKEG